MRHPIHSKDPDRPSRSSQRLARLLAPAALLLLANSAAAQTYTTTNPGQGIWDYHTSYSTITVPNRAGSILDLDVSVSLNHSFSADLVFRLTSPEGTTGVFWNHNGGGVNFGGTYVFDDEAFGLPPTGGWTIPSGTYLPPADPMSLFDGEAANGTWTLAISDEWGADSGWLSLWSLIFQLGELAPPIDYAAMAQVTSSGLPTNAATAYLVNALNSVALRDFGGRLFELRKRLVANGLLGQTSAQNTSTLSQFVALLNRAGVDPKTGLGMDDKVKQPWMGFVSLHPMAGYTLLPSTSASALSHLLSAKQPTVEDPKAVITSERGKVFATFNYANIDQTALIRGIESDAYASTVGGELAVRDWLGIGGGWSHLWNYATLDQLGSVDLEGNAATVYGTAFWRNAYADVLYSYADIRADIVRKTGIGDPVRGAPDGDTHTVALNLGYNLQASFLPQGVWGPYFSSAYTRGQLDAYTETGDPRAIVNYDSQKLDSLVTHLGWQVTWTSQVRQALVTPQVRVGWGRENFEQQRNVVGSLVTSPFGIGGDAFRATLQTDEPQTDWFALGAGVEVAFPNNFSVLFDYEGNFGQDDAERNYLQLQGKISF